MFTDLGAPHAEGSTLGHSEPDFVDGAVSWRWGRLGPQGRELGDEARPVPFVFQSNVAASNAKLALFYDWLFFSPEKDSIMNIGVCPRQPRRTLWGSAAVPVPATAPLTSKESCFDEAQRSCTLSSAWPGARAGGTGGCAVGVGRLQHMRPLLPLPPSSRLSAEDQGAGTSASSCSGAGSVGMGAGTHTLSAVHIY